MQNNKKARERITSVLTTPSDGQCQLPEAGKEG